MSSFACTQLNGFKYSYLTLITWFDINHFYTQSQLFQVLLFKINNSVYQVFLSNMNNLHITVWFQVTNNNNNNNP